MSKSAKYWRSKLEISKIYNWPNKCLVPENISGTSWKPNGPDCKPSIPLGWSYSTRNNGGGQFKIAHTYRTMYARSSVPAWINLDFKKTTKTRSAGASTVQVPIALQLSLPNERETKSDDKELLPKHQKYRFWWSLEKMLLSLYIVSIGCHFIAYI